MEVYEYQAIAFVLNIRKTASKSSLKRKMQEFLVKFQDGYKFYVYGDNLMDHKSSLLAAIANYKFENLDVMSLVRDACGKLSVIHYAKKVVHVVSDHNMKDKYELKKIERICQNNDVVLNYWNLSQIPDGLLSYYKDLS